MALTTSKECPFVFSAFYPLQAGILTWSRRNKKRMEKTA
jgi:hypothetical protein